MLILSLFMSINTFAMPVNKEIILIDPGHGGWDPGKVGKNDELEKEINLKISEYLQMFLEQGGAMAFLTRAEDVALADKKNADLKARTIMPDDLQATILISIHQNSFNNGNVKGGQVFYYEGSEKGKILAEAIQNNINIFLDNGTKPAKANDNYYILKNSEVAAVIIECGFLSNVEEARRLMESDYQQKVAWAVYMGLCEYFKGA